MDLSSLAPGAGRVRGAAPLMLGTTVVPSSPVCKVTAAWRRRSGRSRGAGRVEQQPGAVAVHGQPAGADERVDAARGQERNPAAPGTSRNPCSGRPAAELAARAAIRSTCSSVSSIAARAARGPVKARLGVVSSGPGSGSDSPPSGSELPPVLLVARRAARRAAGRASRRPLSCTRGTSSSTWPGGEVARGRSARARFASSAAAISPRAGPHSGAELLLDHRVDPPPQGDPPHDGPPIGGRHAPAGAWVGVT